MTSATYLAQTVGAPEQLNFMTISSSPSTRRVYATRVEVTTPANLGLRAIEHGCVTLGPDGFTPDVGQLLDKLATGELVITER